MSPARDAAAPIGPVETLTIERIRAVLATIPDPEMPVNLVDLGIIEEVRLAPQPSGGRIDVEVVVTPTFVGCPALYVIEENIKAKVSALHGVGDVAVRFVHSPPWSVERISDAGREELRRFGVTVPARGGTYTTADAAGQLVPLTISSGPEPIACPFCSSPQTRMESAFGPTRCKMIYYCDNCRNSFEHMKRV